MRVTLDEEVPMSSRKLLAGAALAGASLLATLILVAQPLLACSAKKGAAGCSGKGVRASAASAGASCCAKGMKASAGAMGAGLGSGRCEKGTASAARTCPLKASRRASAIGAIATPIPYHDAKRMVLSGQYVCGRCTLQKLDFCQGFLKTTDGNLYPLLMNGMAREMMKKRSKQLKVVAQVRKVQGVKFLDVKAFKVL